MPELVSHFLGNTELYLSFNEYHVSLNNYAANNDFEDWHSHRHASLSFLLSGNYQEEINKTKYNRQPGDIKFIPSGEIHRCYNYTNNARKINVELPESLLLKMEIDVDKMRYVSNSAQIKFTLLKFCREMQNGSDAQQASLQMLYHDLLHPGIAGSKPIKRQLPQWAILLKDLLIEEAHLSLDLNTLAMRLNVHPVTISRYFPHYFGKSFSEYIRQLKVEKALGLIKNSRLSLTEIAFSCGFSDQSHFCHTFKAITGYLPKEYRSF